MNYSEMTDFEISKAVGSAIGINWENLDSNYHALSIWDDGELCVFDPCNSWADAGPIIQDNAIGIMPFKKGPSEAWSLAAGLLSNTTVKDNNPLRAAMIVFLMMQEGK